jgi:hypothetical protein
VPPQSKKSARVHELDDEARSEIGGGGNFDCSVRKIGDKPSRYVNFSQTNEGRERLKKKQIQGNSFSET